MPISDWSSYVFASDLEPRGRHWVGQVAGHRRSIAGKDEPLISAVLLVVIEPQARLDADAVADLPTELAEQREAGVLQILGVDRGQPIEHRWIVRQGIRRVDRPVARCRAVAFRALRVDPLLKGETAEHEVEALAADIIAQILRILGLLRRE